MAKEWWKESGKEEFDGRQRKLLRKVIGRIE
jgi:hypothetical protein